MKQLLPPTAPILIVDDEPAWLRSLGILIERSLNIETILTTTSGAEALAMVRRQPVGLVLLDITMPDPGGEQVLAELLEIAPDLPVIIHTGRNEVDIAVRCMRLGAFDYFLKTVEQDRLVTGIRRALAMAELRAQNRLLQEHLVTRRLRSPEIFQEMISCSPVVFDLCAYLEAIAGSREPLLITGESGVGKELFAQALWKLHSPHGPWQAVNVAGLDDNVFADTLFGHVRGAYTGADAARSGLIEQASGGVLFLDEIGDLSLTSQVKLLRLLQGGDYLPLGSDRPKRANLRIVTATNQDLEQAVADGRFRRDLYYRLKTHHAHLPPLRERRQDIPLLAEHFVAEASHSLGRSTPRLADELLARLQSLPFPGNIRELRSLLYDAVSRCPGEVLTVAGTALPGRETGGASSLPGADEGIRPIWPHRLPTLDEAGDDLVGEAMRRAGGNQTVAARMLGITRQGLAKRLKR